MTRSSQNQKSNRGRPQHDDFFESMPATFDQFYVPDMSEITPDRTETEHDYTREARSTAIITLLLTFLVAIALGALLVRGLGTIKNTVPTGNTSSTLEM